MYKGQRKRLAEEAAKLRELERRYSDEADAIEDRLEQEERASGRPIWTP